MCHQEMLTQTYRAATSKAAQRTLLNTVLLTSASTFLYVLAAIAYILFYNAYLPDQVTTLPIHLQYGYGPNPYGVSPLPNIKDYQAYDISVSLTLPRSPTNVDRGNFMIALYLLDRPGTATSPPVSDHQLLDTTPASLFPPPDPRTHLSTRRILHTSHRPTLIPYTDPIVSLASRLLFLPGHVFFPSSSRASTTTLTIPLAEKLSFPLSPATTSVPSSLFVELQSGQDLRVASASVTVTAQLSGLRWLMHAYRLPSFLAGTAAFWACEVASMALAWLLLSALLFSGPAADEPPKIEGGQKTVGNKMVGGAGEQQDMSDTERTFPTSSRAPPLKYESVKEEDAAPVSMAEVPVAAGGEADDEDDQEEEEGGDGWRDSGIGTSYSDAGAGVGGVRRRTSGKGR
ncbi:hypothetical protein BR93DRAFT_939925 [Coniochaeta sp. PMI_546]|nr:hypothetical protein BR93DRAFT_939925 [Coniochaeta sp. PMI_546]